MKNYTTLSANLKEQTAKFVKELSNGLGKVDTHFISDITVGVLAKNSVILSDIVRMTNENVNIKKGVERIERHLDNYDKIEKVIDENYSKIVKPYINPRKLYFVDRGDIVKDSNTKFENKGYVLDGSDEHKIKQGYQLNSICTLDNANQPISLVSELRSSNDNDYLSDNKLWITHIENVSKTYGKGTFIFDRGYDGAILMQEIIKAENDFIIRAKSLDRKVIYLGEKTTISDIGKKTKGKHNFLTKVDGKDVDLKVSSFNIRIENKDAKELKNHLLTLVIVKGYVLDKRTLNEAYMALITSRKVSGKNEVLQVVKDYILRWKIEENFKYQKQQFKLESIMVRRYKRIKVLYKLLSMIMFFNNTLNIKAIEKTIRKIVPQLKKEVKFWLYRVSKGVKEILTFFSAEVMKLLYPKRLSRRRDLFTVMGVYFRY